jgi:hypothetical protein
VSLSVWLLETFISQDLIKEFLIDAPIPDMKRFIAGLLNVAMKSVYAFEEPTIRQYCDLVEGGKVCEYI